MTITVTPEVPGSDAGQATTPTTDRTVPPAPDPAETKRILSHFPPLEAHGIALQPEHVALLDGLSYLPRYNIEVDLFPALNTLWGRATVAVRNNSPVSWSRLVFRLPANMPRLQTRMQIHSVQVNGQVVTPMDSVSSTVLAIPLETALAPGHWIQVDLEWQLQYVQGDGDLNSYILQGSNQDMISLPHFYPELAVFAPGALGTTNGWWTAEVPEFSDIRFHVATLMQVSANLPKDLVVVGSGIEVEAVLLDNDRIRYSWITGPVRGFVLQASPHYHTAAIEIGGITVRSYHHAIDEAVAQEALGYARTAIRAFERHFGPYPYSQLLIVSSPLGTRGMEYSNLLQIGVLRYRDQPDGTAWLIVHEVSHQWWYLQVHNDPVHFADIDEGLAELSYLFWLEEALADYDHQALSDHWRTSIEEFDNTYEGPFPWWQAITYQDLIHYYRANYTRPAAFLDKAWAIAGDTAFREALQNYLRDNRFQIVTFQQLATALRHVTEDEQMASLIQAWRSQKQLLP